jgi:hypothetical protein
MSGVSENDTHVGYFWEALSQFTSKERSLFLRFVWGRSRLPASKTKFSQMFKIEDFQLKSLPADSYLPVAHTCFFSIELPQYSSLKVMIEKLRYACHNCKAIDADDTDDAIQVGSLGWD